MRTPQEIVDQTNSLAREFYRRRGYVVPEGYRFDKATHPHQREAWAAARQAQLQFTCTDPEDALQKLEEEEEEK